MAAKFSIIDFNANDVDTRRKFNSFIANGDFDDFRKDSDVETNLRLGKLIKNLEWNEYTNRA